MNPSTIQARVVIDELVRCGITDIVLAPGSRSAPLAIAVAQAEQRGEVTVHVRIDERSAGYLALGLGKVTGVPAAVITTSGTAAVNLHPAMVEADLSDVPLLAVTADRPPELRGVGANQSIEQVGVFGGCVRASIDLATADRGSLEAELGVQHNRYWRSTIARAVALATDAMRPGPVHLNLPFADPLVPDAADMAPAGAGMDMAPDDPSAYLPGPFAGRPDQRPWTADARLVAGVGVPLDELLESITDASMADESSVEGVIVAARGLIVVGDHADPEAAALVDELADALGWPVIGEPSGNVATASTALSHGPLLLADPDFAADHVPDVVITVGRVGLNRAVGRQVSRSRFHIAVDPRPQWSDPGRSCDVVVAQVPLPPSAAESDPSWLASWQRADVLASAAIETALAAEADAFTGIEVARLVAAAVPGGGLLFLGPSWPVRHVYAFAATAAQEASVLGNRGTSGIDGCISTAWGSAIGWQRDEGASAIALVGDLTFWYDSGGLLVPADEPLPDLVLVVVDNDGGGIFSQLEQGGTAYAGVFERVFGTPLGSDVAGQASAAGLPVATVDSAESLRVALAEALEAGGVQVVVARTCARSQEASILAAVQQAVGTALEAQQ